MLWVLLSPYRFHQKEQAPAELALTVAQQSLQEPYEAEERVPNEGSITCFVLCVVCICPRKAKNHNGVLDEVALDGLLFLGASAHQSRRSSWQCFLWPGRRLGNRVAQVLLGYLTIRSHSSFLPDF